MANALAAARLRDRCLRLLLCLKLPLTSLELFLLLPPISLVLEKLTLETESGLVWLLSEIGNLDSLDVGAEWVTGELLGGGKEIVGMVDGMDGVDEGGRDGTV